MNFVSNSMIIIMAYYTSITMAKTYIRCSENKAMSCSYNPLEVDKFTSSRFQHKTSFPRKVIDFLTLPIDSSLQSL